MTILDDLDKIRPLNKEAVATIVKQMRAAVRAYKLRELREALELTQVQLAAKIDVSQNRISRIEHGDIEKSQVDTLRKYVEAVGGTLRLEVEIGDQRFTLA
ncbi:XRE family transcriptional regulator [Alpinimonas psychrophila]|uniref:Transcriptional regulator with XRE-family HTH domain n=1 Tax=Alpinimonas psychrophila TaxID=748908 RepID=A0A7W3JUF6_9MICO|nr:helix-turn-helix transcriptional regulator [Alpinimonas psychrophila]MBA8829446.1 transcriptional regulator with XRE-family HTH domain [Alpinimonas psychrophila]